MSTSVLRAVICHPKRKEEDKYYNNTKEKRRPRGKKKTGYAD